MHQHQTAPKEEIFLKDKVIFMPEGIIGFSHLRHYDLCPLSDEKDQTGFWQLKGKEEQDIRFLLVPAELVKQHIAIDLEDLKEALGQYGKEAFFSQLRIFYITTIKPQQENLPEITINVRAPVVIDVDIAQAWQLILKDPKYPIRYLLTSTSVEG